MNVFKWEIKKIADQLNLQVEDEKNNILKGSFGGFNVCMKYNYKYSSSVSNYAFSFSVKQRGETPPEYFNAYFEELKKRFKTVISLQYVQHSLIVMVNPSFPAKKTGETLRNILDDVTRYLSSNGFINCCGCCDSELGISSYIINDQCYLLCSNCFNEIVSGLEQDKHEAKHRKTNIFIGLVGAFLGSLIGVALWVLIYQFGYLAAAAGLAIIVCAVKGYTLFEKNITKLSILLIIILSIGMIFVAENLCMAIELFNALQGEYEISFFEAYRAIPELIASEPEVQSAFISDIVIGILLTVVGSFRFVINAFKQASGSYSAKQTADSER